MRLDHRAAGPFNGRCGAAPPAWACHSVLQKECGRPRRVHSQRRHNMNSNALRRIHLGRVRLVPPIVAALLAVQACSPGPSTPTPPLQVGTIAVSTTEPSTQATSPSMGGDGGECSHDYFPSELGTAWEIAGTNRMSGAYQKSSTITVSSDDG